MDSDGQATQEPVQPGADLGGETPAISPIQSETQDAAMGAQDDESFEGILSKMKVARKSKLKRRSSALRCPPCR